MATSLVLLITTWTFHSVTLGRPFSITWSMRSSQRPLYAKHCSYYSSTHIHAKAWAHVLKNIGTPIMELLYFIHSWFFNDMHRLYLYVDVWRVLSPIYLIQGLGFISHGLCVLIYVFQHVESASPAWVLLGHTCLWLLMRGANTNQCINIVVVATPYNPQLRDFQLWKNPHPWVRPSPSGYLELICKSFLMIDLSLSSHSSSTKGIQYLRILHALCLPTQSLSTSKFRVQGNQYLRYYTPCACHSIVALPLISLSLWLILPKLQSLYA